MATLHPIDSYEIAAIITAHHEGIMAGVSLKSLLDAREHALRHGLRIECIAVLDRPNAATEAAFSGCTGDGWKLLLTDFGDQGLARNEAVKSASAGHVAFLDADDLWSFNWLSEAWKVCSQNLENVVAHPEYNWFFQGNNNVYLKMDQSDPWFDQAFLRFGNYWDALCLAPKRAYLAHPFAARDIESGFAFEDWQWNCETINAGFVHRIVDGTIHFKRRRPRSQTLEASGRKALMRPTRLTSFESYPFDLPCR